ncbi:hypothetical protein CWI84_10015 [Idiomarina tyrosinivorans]|uniref:DNA repair protein n=1 Tax=Idiomarina tyrosinivorans TaxID=1445662 RepID=A0A432ZLM0_9GAMM|nr:hypothetical protein [Idiomarina tyrosinivorans]RUO78881.1 hypothetical protein CWI84_10015 [Idiomarina tyrosinivorans]
MIYTTVIILIVVLVVLAIIVNAVQQRKQRQDIERRQRLYRFRNMLEHCEDLISVASQLPIGKALITVLHRRAREALSGMYSVNPSEDLKKRIQEYDERLNAMKDDDGLMTESFELPENDKQIIAMINAVKRLRSTLRNEHSRGRVDSQVFINEDHRLVKLQVKITVESLIRRGKSAYHSQMLGSSRQYYEKALKTIENQDYSDDYLNGRKATIENELEQITSELRDVNARDAASRKRDELEELFQPKKKW